MITVLMLLEAYSKPTLFRNASVSRRDEYSVWIVPIGTEGDDDIDAILARSGIRVLERVSQDEAERCADDILHKFKTAGLPVEREFLCND